jgi:hypothetical protein
MSSFQACLFVPYVILLVLPGRTKIDFNVFVLHVLLPFNNFNPIVVIARERGILLLMSSVQACLFAPYMVLLVFPGRTKIVYCFCSACPGAPQQFRSHLRCKGGTISGHSSGLLRDRRITRIQIPVATSCGSVWSFVSCFFSFLR